MKTTLRDGTTLFEPDPLERGSDDFEMSLEDNVKRAIVWPFVVVAVGVGIILFSWLVSIFVG